LREIWLIATARRAARERRDLALAWHVAALTRAGRFPSLTELLEPPKRKAQKSAEDRRRDHDRIVTDMGKKP
jgi:hypothetical protein